MKKRWLALLGGLSLLAGLAGGFFLGRASAPETLSWREVVTFPAVILEKREGATTKGNLYRTLLVEGLADNDVNDRGRFTVPVAEETALTWRGTAIAWEDLDEGDRVKITYAGEVLETYPARLETALAVQLTEDQK